VAYLDTKGILSVGVGHNCEASPCYFIIGRPISKVGDTITRAEETRLLEDDIDVAERACSHIDCYAGLSENRQHVLLDMVFNMGVGKVLQFKHMLASLRAGLYREAAAHLLDSEYAREVKSRAIRLAVMLRDDLSFKDALRVVP
jgi:lysozyme